MGHIALEFIIIKIKGLHILHSGGTIGRAHFCAELNGFDSPISGFLVPSLSGSEVHLPLETLDYKLRAIFSLVCFLRALS